MNNPAIRYGCANPDCGYSRSYLTRRSPTATAPAR